MNDSVVKSAGRVFEVLELFNSERKALTATGISRSLKYPASSAVALLKSLVNRGYLSYDPAERTYFPTVQLPLMARWLEDSFYVDGHLLDLMDEVSKATGETVYLAWQNDLEMQTARARGGTKEPCADPLESRISLFESVSGLTALTLKRDVEIAQLAERASALGKASGTKIDLPSAMERIRTFRTQGYGVGYDGSQPGTGRLAWAFRPQTVNRALVMLLIGPTDRIRSEAKTLTNAVQSVVRRHSA